MPERSFSHGLERPPPVHTRDLEMARVLLAKGWGDLTLDLVRDGRTFEWRADHVDLGPVGVTSGIITSGVIIRGETPNYLVRMGTGSPEQASSPVDRAEVVPGRSAAVFSPGARSELSTVGASRPLTLRIDSRYLEAQLEALTGVPVRRPVAFALSMSTAGGAGTFIERMCQLLAAEAARAGSALGHPLVRSSLGEALTRALLLGHPHDHTPHLERPAPPSSRAVVRLVEEYVDAHAGEPVRATDLTALVGASMASIEAAFRAHRGTTPAAFLRKRRLLLARDRLLAADPGTTVTDVAHASGFVRRERFHAAYAAEIGETPSETRRRGLLATEPPPPPDRQRVTSIPSPSPSSSPSPSTVFVIHTDPHARETLSETLREAGHEVRAFASPAALRASWPSSGAACAVLEACLVERDEPDPSAALRRSACGLPVVLTSTDGELRMAVEAMKAGAVDFLVEPVDPAALRTAVEQALSRDAAEQSARAEEAALAALVAALSPREREVCERVARGMLNKQIAADLGISESAVRLYRAKGMEKLRVGSAAELASVFTRLG